MIYIREVYDFIKGHPNCNLQDIIDGIKVPQSNIRIFTEDLTSLEMSGIIIASGHGQERTYSA